MHPSSCTAPQSAAQVTDPAAYPRVWQVTPPNASPSHTSPSPSSRLPSPQKAARAPQPGMHPP